MLTISTYVFSKSISDPRNEDEAIGKAVKTKAEEEVKISEEMLKKECPYAKVAFDYMICANFLKQNIAKRERTKGQ